MAVFSNISLFRFEQKTQNITVSGGMSGMSGCAVAFSVRNRWDGESGLITKSLNSGFVTGESGLTIVNQVSGTIGITFVTADTSGLIAKNLTWDLTRTTSGRLVTNAGYVNLLPPVGTP